MCQVLRCSEGTSALLQAVLAQQGGGILGFEDGGGVGLDGQGDGDGGAVGVADHQGGDDADGNGDGNAPGDALDNGGPVRSDGAERGLHGGGSDGMVTRCSPERRRRESAAGLRMAGQQHGR
jgi:hypothetical protein